MNTTAQPGALLPFLVTVMEAAEGQPVIHFECQAESADHANEQAVNAYPGAKVLSILDTSLFPHELLVCIDPTSQDRPSIGFHHEGMEISDPFTSPCGRFIVEPSEYGLDYAHAHQLQRLNEVVSAATEAAITQATAQLNPHLQGAGYEPQQAFFQGQCVERNAVWGSLAAYVVASMNASHRKRKEQSIAAASVPQSISRIGEEGIGFVIDERSVFPGVKACWNAMPLPRGQVCFYGQPQDGFSSQWVESSQITIRVFNLDGDALATYVVHGRDGLNSVYEALVGYRPDEDSFEPDAVKLLASVCEMAYRHATGDDN